jgi:D-amino-acid oxidase
LLLRRRGFGVTVVADNFAPRVTSVVAGALWEWPPAVCGYHQDEQSLLRSKCWCRASYRQFADLAQDPATGVFMRRATFYFKQRVAENQRHFAKMNEVQEHVDQFVHDAGLIVANRVNPEFGVRDAYAHLAPMVDTDVYMTWLMDEVRRAGCRVACQKIIGLLAPQEISLRNQFQVEAIVNCSGLGARELADDDMYPLRGALVRVRNDGRTMPRINDAHCVAHDEDSHEQDMVFIVPRGRDQLVLGGLTEPGEWDLDIGLHNYEGVRKMHRRCIDFLPVLKDAEIDAVEPVRVGLRPARRQNIRLEWQEGTRIIHNYGHGGSGVTLSWGCAAEVAELVETLWRSFPSARD